MIRAAVAVIAAIACLSALAPAPASASVVGKACNLAGGLAGKACDLASNPGKVLSAGKNLITGHLGSALNDLLGGGASAASKASTALAVAAVVAWAVGGAKFALDETAKILTHTTRPNLRSTWFSGAYWQMAGISALLTLPFLFAAAVQALMRSDLGLLAQAALGYLPLSLLAVSIAAPVATLLLAATDQLCGLVSAIGAGGGARFLTGAGEVFVGAHFAGQAFVTFLLAAITAGGALILWLELAVREAAVYVIVLMLPLAFAALVWPARRVWAARSVELLVALILSKFAIVAVLGLAGAALNQGSQGGLTTALAGTVLVLLAAFAPWALVRLLPLSELAAGAVSTLGPELERALHHGAREDGPARQTPPTQRLERELGTGAEQERDTGAEHERDRLRDQASAAGSERREIADRHAGDELRADSEQGATAHSSEEPQAADIDGRPGVLHPVGVSAERADDEQSRSEQPAFPLGAAGFDDQRWSGPVSDLLSGEPGEDRDPLPPSDREDLL